MNNLASVFNSPWAITRQAFDTVQAIAARHFAGERADVAAIEAATGKPLANAQRPLEMHGSVAVVALDGVLSKRVNMLSQISGGTSTQIAGQQFAQALADPAVTAIVLAVDSPGGTVDGTQALADAVYAARRRKPVTAVIDGLGASAAYWIASAADAVYITGDTTTVGSIGVIAQHTDVSAAEAARGVKVTEVVAGQYKNATSPHKPLSDTGRAVIQAQVDRLYGAFLGDVARNRGVGAELAHKVMGDGRVFIGRDAVKAGLVDGVATLANAIANAQVAAVTGTDTPARAASPGDLARLAHARIREVAALGHTMSFAAAYAEVQEK